MPLDAARDAVAAEFGGAPLTPEQDATVASLLGGTTDAAEAVPPPGSPEAPASSTPAQETPQDAPRQGATSDLTIGDGWEMLDMQPAEPADTPVVDADGERVLPEYKDVSELTDDEATAFGATLARAMSMTLGDMSLGTSNPERPWSEVLAFLSKVAPSMSDRDKERVASAYIATGGRYVGDDKWVFTDADNDEEGVVPDGVEFNGLRNVNILKSSAFRRLLAIISRVSPATGRDFQPFVEDLRDFVYSAPFVLADQMAARPDLASAVDYLRELLNPRANNDYDDQLDAANARDAAHHRLLTWFVPPSPGRESPNWAKLQIFVSEFFRGDTPVCARAGMFLAHLMGQTPETLSQMLSFVSNSAPATPVQLREVRTAKGEIAFLLQPAVPKKNTPSPDMLTASFLRLAGKSPAEVRAKADELDAAFMAEYDKAVAEGWSGYLTSVPKQSGRRTDHHGLMDVYARAMSKVFGSDSPVAVPFVSRLFDRSMARATAEGRERGGYAKLLQDFVFPPDGGPPAVKDISDMLREVADASTGEVTRDALSNAAVAVFQSGGPRLRQANFAPASTMDIAPWSRLLLAFSESKPVSVMTADVDPARNRGAKPSLAITMPGVEPALQQFLDRNDDRGFHKRLEKWFPDAFNRRDFDIGLLRQRMEWPGGVGIVAKNKTKTAYATEVFAGARAAYEAKDATMLYVPVYSGDHSSSIIVQIPIAKALKAEGYSYIEAAKMVSRMLGMDLFGVDAKRSAVTCLEAPAVSLWGFGEKTDAAGKFLERGHVKYAVLWNSAPGADNEAFKGSLSLFGYGARRLRMLSRDRNLAAVKCHIAPTGDDKWGTMPGLTKALATAYFPGADKLGTFLEGSPMEKLVKFAEGLVSDGLSSAIVTDADSVKMDVLNSKMICVRTGDGKYKTIMDYVLNERLRQYLDRPENAGKSVTLADVMGDEAVSVWNRAEDREVFSGDLADFIPGLELRDAKDGMYALIRDADNFTAFQVANVAHAAEADDGELSRNYVMDIGNLAVTLGGHNADTVAGTQIYKNAAAVTGSVRELMTSYGMLAAALVHDPKSIEIRLEDDEEYKALKAAGLPMDGDMADEIRRRVYAAWVRETRTPPVTTIPAALVANGSWIEAVNDPRTGKTRLVGKSHSKSAMFNDTLQGPRSIAKEDREFMRAAHRVALCNVNCADPAFRHGLYINEDILGDAQFKAQGWVPEWGAGTGVSKRDALVQLVERIVTEIVQAPQTDAEGEQGLRELFGTYLYDHRGTTLFDRQVPDGRSAADAVSYLDLFTQVTSADGSFQFDRAAIYERMHDKDGKVCFYLGGTMFGLPRTPSYNGQVQQVRAALPVTEIDDAGNPEQWREGKDAWVAPDPFTLKILGCDHDGDKSALYLLDFSGWHIEGDEGRKFALTPAEVQALFAGAEDIRSPQGLAAWRERLTEQGVFHRTGSGELRFDRTFAKRLANTVALGAFDLNRMLPVFDDEGDVSLYAGYRADGERPGNPWRGTKTTPGPNMQKPEDPPDFLREKAMSPGSAWDIASGQEGVLAPKVLDLEVPAKRLENVETAMKAQTSGKLVSEARARFVAAARDFHALRLAGFDNAGFMALVRSPQDFIDLLYHLDGPNNMSFDDMKEQVCSRLGLLPGMIDTFLAEYSGLMTGNAALTDRAAVANAAAYGAKVNDPTHFYHWMKRASDPSDTEFRNLWAASVREEAVGDKDVKRLEPFVGTDVALDFVRKAEDAGPLEPVVGALYAARKDKNLDGLAWWHNAVRQLEEQRRIAASLNYTYSDPGEDSSAADWVKAVSDANKETEDGEPVYSTVQKRMLLATGFLNGGIGSTFMNRGVSAVHNVDVNFQRALAGIPVKGASTFEGMFLAAASYTPKLGWDKTLQAANNARMVGRAAAAFANPLAVPGSPFNSDDADPVSRFYRQCSLIAEAVASARHPARKAAVGSRPAVQTNATLDFCWFVESAVDLVSRLVASQPGVERDFQLSDYIREMPSGTESMFDSGTYGPAAENSARITLALGGLSSDTLRRSQEVLGRVVYGRELDSDGELGKRPFQPRGRNKPVAGVSFALSEQSLRALALYFSKLNTKRDVKAESRGEQRDLASTAHRLADVLKTLSSRHPDLFPPGFTIQPSALFGQLLPAYASITDFVDGAPGPDSRALQMLFPNDVIMQEEAVRDARSNAHLAPYLSLAEAFDWSAKTQNRQKFKDEPATARSRSATAAAAMKAGAKLDGSLLDQVDPDTGKTLKKLVKAAIKESGSGLYWDEDQPAGGPRFLGVFDGTRGAAFEALVAMFRNAPIYAAVDARSITPTYWPSYNEAPVQVWAPGRKEPSAQTPGAAKSPYGYLLQQPAVRPAPVSTSAKPISRPSSASGYVNHSGGAIGSDSAWGDIGREYGVASNHYYYQSRTPKGNVDIAGTPGAYEEGLEHYRAALGPLGRTSEASKPYVLGLMSRNWQQVKNSDAVFAVGQRISKDGHIVSIKNGKEQLSGTAYAVQMAKDAGKPIHVFEQERKQWFRWENGKWIQEETPVLTRDFAGIGTREIDESGRQAIRDVYEKTFRKSVSTQKAESPRVDPAAVKEIARTVGQVFRLWSDAHIRPGEDDQSFSITVNMRVAGETRPVRMNVRVSREIAGASEDAVIRTLAMRTGRAEDELRKDPALLASLKAQYSIAGRTTRPTAFRLSTSDVGVLMADVELAAANAIKDATAFHEAFHAAIEFAYAAGALSESDIAELAKKYNKKGQTFKRPDGGDWFDTEAAANDFQELLKGGLSEARKESKGVVERILQKLFEFVKSLAAALKGVIASHTSEDFGRDVRENPLTGFVLTGELNPSTLAEQAASMDFRTRVYQALDEFAARDGWGFTEDDFNRAWELRKDVLALRRLDPESDEIPENITESECLELIGMKDGAGGPHTAEVADELAPTWREDIVLANYMAQAMRLNGPENHGPVMVDPASGKTSESVNHELNVSGTEDDPARFADLPTSVATLESPRTILSNEELAIWNEKGLGPNPRILAASERTDPVFHAQELIDILDGKKSVKDRLGKEVTRDDINGLYIVTKHDGIPLRKLFEYKIPKLVHFSITGLGGTKWEPGVMKPDDLLDRIGEFIKDGLDPKSVTVRIDPIVPGVTTPAMVRHIMERAVGMGIRRIRFSVLDAYPAIIKAMRDRGYDFDANGYVDDTKNPVRDIKTPYGRLIKGGIPKHATFERRHGIAAMMKRLADEFGITLGSCAEANLGVEGITHEGCLSTTAVAQMLGTEIAESKSGQRLACSCFGGKVDALSYDHRCGSACVYCYARHGSDAAMRYYDSDGKLLDNAFTRTRPEIQKVAEPGTTLNTPNRDSAAALGVKPNPYEYLKADPRRAAVAAFFDAQNYHPADREATVTKWLARSTPERIAEIVAQYGEKPTVEPADDESAANAILDELDMQPVIPKVREELDRAGIPRMAVPYSKADTLAAAVGSILRQGETPDAVAAVDALAPVKDAKSQQYTDWQIRRMRDAVRRLSSLYGVAQNDDKGREQLLFRALNEVAEDLQRRQDARDSGMGRKRTHVSAAGLAAKVAVASGVRPCDILEAALQDVLEIRSRCNPKLAAALDERMLPVLRRLYAQSADPTGLLRQFAPAESEGPTKSDPHDVFAELSAGVVSDRDAQGSHLRYRVTNLDANGRPATNNPFAPANIAAYKDHEQDQDFQDAMRTALDAVYMTAAARSMYEDLGFTPGDPHATADAAGAMSVLEMLAAAGASPDMYSDPSFRVVSASDEGWFSAAAPQEWLDSMMRPSFGGVDLRAMAQGMNRQVAQFQHRVTALRNLHACEYGLAGNPGDPLLALDPDYKARFSWKDGRIRADVDPTSDPRYGEVRAYQRQNRVAFKDGNGEYRRMDRADVRWMDLLLKARAAHMTGSRYLVTGVNGISFSLEDVADESHYTRERVRERSERGRSSGQSYFDLALERLDIQLADSYGEGFDGIVDSGEGRYGLRDRFVGSACAALREAKRLVELTESGALTADEGLRRSDVNDYVIHRLVRDGIAAGVQSFHGKTPKYTSAALALDVDRMEDLFRQTAAYRKLTDAGRKEEWLSREAYERPYLDLLREMRSFANANPYFTDGDGRFFLGVASPLHFSRGGGATLWGLGKAPEHDALQTAVEVQSQFASDLEDLLRGSLMGVAPARDADARALRMLRAVYRLPNSDVESMRYALEQGRYEGVNGCPLTKDSTARDLLDAITSRLRDLVWGEATDGRGLEEFGGPARVKTLLEKHWADPDPDAVANVSGLSQDAIYCMTGTLPANFEAGHAVQSMVDGLSNAIAYRATLVNMVTTPDADGMPLCYAKPSLVPDETGLPDAVWGAVARWWGELHNLAYDGTKTGVENARAMYEEIVEHGRIDRKEFGTLSKDDMDSRAVDEFVARKGVPEGESELNRVAGGYALGYAKHLFQSTRGLGGKWQRAVVHRALAYSKAMSVSFSLFFPLATKYESPIGAVGLAATVGGTLNADFMREHADAIRKVLGATGLGWVTRDFVGEQDFAKMLDSNDPFLSDMYRFASAIGLTMSTSLANPLEHSRGVMQQDLADFTGWVRRNLGDKAAKKVADASGTLLTRASEKAFTYHLNAVKLAVASQMCMKLQADAQARGIAFDPVRDMRRYSSYINAEVGGIDPLQYAWLHPGMRSKLEAAFFSWNWTRGAWEAGGGKILEQVLFGGHDVTPEERRYMLGRAIRMWGWVAFGLPTLAQVLVKAIGMGIDPDHEDRDDEPWWIWENEDKAFMKSFNLRPLMRAIAKRFPAYAELRGEHPVVAGLPMLGFAATRNPWLLGAAVLSGMPVQTGKDEQNVTGNRAYYMHFAKQAWEFERWFDAPLQQFLSKLSMPVQRLFEGLTGRSLTMPDMKFAWHDKGDAERWLYPTGDSATVNMLKAFLPFSMAGLTQYGDAGLLPVLGPVSMGTSGGAATAALADELDKWASNDRRGYAFGGRSASDRGVPRAARAVSDNPVVRRHVAQLRANGYSEPQILSMLDRALGSLSSKRIRRLVDLMPDEADGSYDTREFGRLVRELRRLGRTRQGIYKSVRDRLEHAGRKPAAESKTRATELIANEVARPYTY